MSFNGNTPDMVPQVPANSNEVVELADEMNHKSSDKHSYSILFGLSICSALVIASLWFTFQSGWLGLLFIAAILIAQFILIIPATLLVFFLHRYISRRNQLPEIHVLNRLGIPLLFNSLPVLVFFTVHILTGMLNENYDNNIRQNLIITVKEDSVILGSKDCDCWLDEEDYYHAVLHVKNDTGKTIEGIRYSVATYSGQHGEYRLGRQADYSPSFPPGESDIEISIRLHPTWCGNITYFQRPLFLNYHFPAKGTTSLYFSIPLNDDMNKELQQWTNETCFNK